MKKWIKSRMKVNGFWVDAEYSEDALEHIFWPLLEKLTQLQAEKKERLIVFLAAPPAVGKTTLALFLEYLARKDEHLADIQSLGLDGFHYHMDYIQSHNVIVAGKEVPMKQVKGCPESYDTERFGEKLRDLANETSLWPLYDRNIHDVVEDAVKVTAPVVLVEGNWLLLEEAPWDVIRKLADYTILIRSGEEMLRERLITRKTKGGLSRREAETWYLNSDSVNVKRALEHSADGDLVLIAREDGDYQVRKEKGEFI